MELDAKHIKSRDFALRIIKLYRFLIDKKAFEIGKQILRCGTSIGANVAEAEYSESDSDFIHKLAIALKEANETEYWLELLYESDYMNDFEFDSIKNDNEELLKLLTSITKTMKNQ